MLGTSFVKSGNATLQLTVAALHPKNSYEILQPLHPATHADVADHMRQAGFIRRTFALRRGPVEGWMRKGPLPPQRWPVRIWIDSDSDEESYLVDVTGNRLDFHNCTCFAGLQAKPCKHLYRARVKKHRSFRSACSSLLAKKTYPDLTTLLASFKTLTKKTGVNGAIALIIEEAFGSAHPHAQLPRLPATQHKRLARYRKKHPVETRS